MRGREEAAKESIERVGQQEEEGDGWCEEEGEMGSVACHELGLTMSTK